MFQGHFYHETIKRIITVFGTLFNNISIIRKDQSGEIIEQLKVPLSYAPKDKILARLEERQDLTNTQITAITLPRMSFEITDLSYDPTVKLPKMNKAVHKIINTNLSPGNRTAQSSYTYAPYSITIQLNIMVKNTDDGLQIIEQIIPFFQPEFTVTIKQLDSLDSIMDLPIVLTSIIPEDSYEGDYTTRKALIYTLTFNTKARFFGPVTTQGIIKKAIITFKNMDTLVPYEKYTAEAISTGSPENDYYILETYENLFYDLII
jgi:hypothetical protein